MMCRLLQFLTLTVLIITNGSLVNANVLSRDVRPLSYTLDLTLTEENLIQGSFTGNVSIEISIDASLQSFPIHAKNLEILNLVLLSSSGNSIDNITFEESNDQSDFLIISSPQYVQSDNYTLTINYNGNLSTTDAEGLYRSIYIDGEETKYLALTNFAPLGARKAFPCFDDPRYKATFQVSITYSEGYSAISNSAPVDEPVDTTEGFKKVTFKEISNTATYVVAFMVSQISCIQDRLNDNNYFEFCARKPNQEAMQLFESVSFPILDILENYTGVEYERMGLGKLTLVAVPDVVFDVMGNWGLVTFSESILLWNPDQSSSVYTKKILDALTHSLAHQWFGDYSSLRIWSDLFVNEGLATYFENYASPSYDNRQFVIDTLQPVLQSDSLSTVLPLVMDNDDPDLTRSDDISSKKGAALLRMLQHLLGWENFTLGLQHYLATYGYIIGDQSLLWLSFDTYFQNHDNFLLNTMSKFSRQTGYPLINVNFTDDEKGVILTQERFSLTPHPDDYLEWDIPITYATSQTKNFTDTATTTWLYSYQYPPFLISLHDADWIILNNQQIGYYRVRYDDKLMQKISTALNNDYQSIDEMSRSQLIDDQFNLARANLQSYEYVLKFISFLKKDDSYYSWSAAFNGFNYLLKRTSSIELRQNLTTFILDHLEALSQTFSLTVNKRSSHSFNEILGLSWACKLGHAPCIENASQIFQAYKNEGSRPDSDYETIVYCNSLRSSSSPTTDFEFLWQNYLKSDNGAERLSILESLGCINNDTIRQQYLEKILTGDIERQNVKIVLSSVYINSVEGPVAVIEFLEKFYLDVIDRLGKQGLVSVIADIVDLLSSQDQITKLTQFINNPALDPDLTARLAAVNTATDNLKEIQGLEITLKRFFDSLNQGSNTQPNSASLSKNQIVNFLLTVVFFCTF